MQASQKKAAWRTGISTFKMIELGISGNQFQSEGQKTARTGVFIINTN